ncbi:MAG: hypothetical protein FWD65_03430 [Coriobacteriia bacterium]|nr:hypothetical protein [Coriobacteriia bacterium]
MKSQKSSPSLGLYKEGLLQLRFMGLLSGGLLVLASVAQLVTTLIATQGLNKGALGGVYSVASPVSLVSYGSLVVYLLPFLFVLRLFNFLNKRNRSDFYHTLPTSRLRFCLSLLAAVLTWIWGIGLVVLALAVATNLASGASVTAAVVATSLGLFFTASLFAVAATLVAASVTGTRFANLIVTALIVLLPHLVASCFVQSVEAVAPNIPAGYVGLFGAAQIQNTFFMLSPFSMLFGAFSMAPVSNSASVIVTFVWAAVLNAAGVWLFVRRPSEAAGKSAPGRWLQLLYRVAVGALVVALGMGTVLGLSSALDSGLGVGPVAYGSTASLSSSVHLGSFVTLLVIALIAFLVFELITTRKWARVARALPSFALVIIFALAFYGAIRLYTSYETRFKPSASQIASVRLLSAQYGMDGMGEGMAPGLLGSGGAADYTGQTPTYNQLLLRQTNIKDPAFLRVTADKLQENFPAEAAYGGTDENHSTMMIEIKMKSGRTAYRLIYVRTGSRPDAFDKTMLTTPEVNYALLALPPLDKHAELSNTPFMAGDNLLPVSSMSAEQSRQSRELYTAFKSEYEKLSPEEQYQIVYGYSMGMPPTPSAETTTVATFTGGSNLGFSGVLGGKAFTNSYTLITPQASALGWKMTNLELIKLLTDHTSGLSLDQFDLYTSQAARALVSMDATDSAAPTDPSWSVMSGRFEKMMYGNEGAYGENGSEVITDDKMTEASKIIRPALARDFALNAPYYAQITYGMYDRQGNEGNQNMITVPLTAQEAAALQALTKK